MGIPVKMNVTFQFFVTVLKFTLKRQNTLKLYLVLLWFKKNEFTKILLNEVRNEKQNVNQKKN